MSQAATIYGSQSRAFTNDFLQNLNASVGPYEDVLACPVGILMLLTTLLGAGGPDGRTAQQIGNALHLGSMSNRDEAYSKATKLFQNVVESLKHEVSYAGKEPIYNVPMSTAMFTDEGLPIEANFQNAFTRNFDGDLYQTNFNNPYAARKVINDWAYRKSYGRIPELITTNNEIQQDTLMALMNIFAFKDNWRGTFNEPRKGYFYASPQIPIPMYMMTLIENMPYINKVMRGFSAVKKPFRNPRFSFVVVLPHSPSNLRAIDDVLFRTKSVRELFRDAQNEYVNLTLPKFHLERKMELIPTLKQLGIRDLFSRATAKLSGITKEPDLFVNLLNQATVLRVDESGVEAVAASYATAAPISMFIPVTFEVDRPFGCMIYDEKLDLPLLVAKVLAPKR